MTDRVNSENIHIGGYGIDYADTQYSRFNWNRKRKRQNLVKKRIPIKLKSPTTDPYVFSLPANATRWTDLQSTIIQGRLRIKHKDGTDVSETENFSVVNCLYQALWRQVGIAINGHEFEDTSTRVYGHKAFLNMLFNISQRYKDLVLSDNQSWCLDTGTSTSLVETTAHPTLKEEEEEEEAELKIMDDANPATVKETKKVKITRKRAKRVPVTGYNPGYVTRRNGLKKGGWMEFHVPLQHDLCTTENVFPPGCRIDFTLHRSDDDFCIIKDAANTANDYMIELDNVHLLVHQIDASDMVNGLYKSITSPYTTIRRNVLKYYMAKQDAVDIGTSGFASMTQLPEQVYVTFIEQNAFYGSATTNPFDLEFMRFDEACLVIDGENFPSRPYVTGKDTGKLEAYMNFLYSTGMAPMSDECVPISPKMWGSHCFVLAFDRSLDGQNGYYANPPTVGTMDLNLKLTQPLRQNMIVLIYCSYVQDVTFDNGELVVKKVGL